MVAGTGEPWVAPVVGSPGRDAVTRQWEELLFSRLDATAQLLWVRFHRLLRPRLKISIKWCLRALALRPAK